jgi:NTE family protein
MPLKAALPRTSSSKTPAAPTTTASTTSKKSSSRTPSDSSTTPRAGSVSRPVNGGARNAPIKPALKLGATHLIVVALHSPQLDETSNEKRRPELIDGAKQLIQGLLIDPLINDLHTLADINEIVRTQSGRPIVVPPNPPNRLEPKTYREVPYIFIAPEHRDIGKAASKVFEEHYDDVWDLRHNVALLGQSLDVDHDTARGELLSYLFFDKYFGSELVDLGAGDATKWIDGVVGGEPLWQTGPPA